MKRKITPDKQKSESLKAMALITLERLKEINLTKYPSNTLTDYYDIIHKLMESLTFKQGVKIQGEGAHKELIDHISKEYHLEEKERIFLQQLRDYRNRISYEGFSINKNYITQHKRKIETIINKLIQNLKT